MLTGLSQKFFHLFRCSGAASLTDAGFAAAAAIEGGVQGFGQGADITARLGKAVAGALFVGCQGRAQAGGGCGLADSQPVQAIRVQPRHDADSIRTGRYLRGQRVKELAAQPEVDAITSATSRPNQVSFNGRIVLPPQRQATVALTIGGVIKNTSLLPGQHVTKNSVIAT